MTTDPDNQLHVIIVAAGIGSRFQAAAHEPIDTPKQYALIDDRPVLWHTIKAFDDVAVCDVTVVVNAADSHWSTFDLSDFKHPIHSCVGGTERHDSVRNGLLSLPPNNSWVLVHDAARPCVSEAEIKKLINQCQTEHSGGLLVKPISDTMKLSEDGIKVAKTIDRETLFAALTPQMFRRKDLLQALTVFEADSITDESSALEAQGHKPLMVKGQSSNIKITTYEDLALAKFILQQQGRL